MPTEKHPQGLQGWTADVSARIAQDDAAIARYSADLAAKLRRQGRDVVAAFLADATKIRELTKSDREELAKFLTSGQPEDTLASDDVARIRAKFVRLETVLAAVIPNNLAALAGFAPAAFLAAAWGLGFWSPIATGINVVCEFILDPQLQTALGMRSSGQHEPAFYTARTFGFAALPWLYFIVAILAAARIWQRAHFIRTIVLNIAIVASVYAYAGFQIIDLKNIESKIPAYCNSRTINGAVQMPTPDQLARFKARQH